MRWRSALPFLQGPASGALVLPGSYTATLEIGGHTASQSFTVVNDPASHASQQDMQTGYETAVAALHELSQFDVASFNQAMDTRHLTGVVAGPTLTP